MNKDILKNQIMMSERNRIYDIFIKAGAKHKSMKSPKFYELFSQLDDYNAIRLFEEVYVSSVFYKAKIKNIALLSLSLFLISTIFFMTLYKITHSSNFLVLGSIIFFITLLISISCSIIYICSSRTKFCKLYRNFRDKYPEDRII